MSERQNADTGSQPVEPGAEAPGFEAPWQARAFALAVALTDEDDLPWRAFQSRLVAEIEADPGAGEEAYFRRWLTALERLLVERDLLDPGDLRERVAAFEAGDRDAHEFVEGDPHGHAEGLPDDHGGGHHYDHSEGRHHDHGEKQHY